MWITTVIHRPSFRTLDLLRLNTMASNRVQREMTPGSSRTKRVRCASGKMLFEQLRVAGRGEGVSCFYHHL